MDPSVFLIFSNYLAIFVPFAVSLLLSHGIGAVAAVHGRC
jgi:hypothetical protein